MLLKKKKKDMLLYLNYLHFLCNKMNTLIPLPPMGREAKNSLSGLSHRSVVSEWNPETSKAYLAIIFALTHGI